MLYGGLIYMGARQAAGVARSEGYTPAEDTIKKSAEDYVGPMYDRNTGKFMWITLKGITS
jgi:hypothetical protein